MISKVSIECSVFELSVFGSGSYMNLLETTFMLVRLGKVDLDLHSKLLANKNMLLSLRRHFLPYKLFFEFSGRCR